MSRFIAVIHGWHVHSNGFTVHEIEAKDMTQAAKEAAYLKDQRQRPFDECAVKVIQISDSEFIQKPARLSWRERITGVVKP
ncbi:TPA: hypothetical protein RM800_000578 [Yersinia enterocolitica]|nr:hypothetical protein [Yersinia enterocolitica]